MQNPEKGYLQPRLIKWTGTLANSADQDQTPHNAVFEQGLHCLLKLQEVKD